MGREWDAPAHRPTAPASSSTTLTPCPASHPAQPADERACAYIAGSAPNRWGNFTAVQQQGRRASDAVVPPPQLEYGASVEEAARAAEIRRAHPLYASIVLGEAGGWISRMGASFA